MQINHELKSYDICQKVRQFINSQNNFYRLILDRKEQIIVMDKTNPSNAKMHYCFPYSMNEIRNDEKYK